MATDATQVSLELALARRGIARASELAADLGVSQPTMSRLLAALGPRVLRLGNARATRYALRRPVRGYGASWPLYRVDENARVVALGELTSLAGDHYLFDLAETAHAPVLAEGRERLAFDGLPWFISDIRPQGFLGRAFARRNAQRLDAPGDLGVWSDQHVIAALLVEGDDLPGDLILGDTMRERAMSAWLREPHAIDAAARANDYDALAAAAMEGEPVGSSAGGEHPKFAVAVCEAARIRHVLVKFTEVGDTPARRRWLDLLVAEHESARALERIGIAAARSQLVEGRERWHLEVERFDRVGDHGRRGVVSLAALDDALYGERDDWPRAAERLARDGWITDEALRAIRVLHWFGRLTANTDMHFGNASFFRGDARPFELAPSYDMLPMLYRPAGNGELVPRRFEPTPPAPAQRDDWSRACDAAEALWRTLAEHPLVSPDFRETAKTNENLLLRARKAFLRA